MIDTDHTTSGSNEEDLLLQVYKRFQKISLHVRAFSNEKVALYIGVAVFHIPN